MPAPRDLFERLADAPVVPGGLPLVVLLTGFTDAGGAVSGAIDYIREDLDPRPVAVFSNDVLLDYRARRPIVTFDKDHLTEFRPPRLELSLVHDALGQPFLLLSGYEPDFVWEAFADAVVAFAREFDVTGLTWVHAIAMPVPHTRGLGVTVSGNRSELIAAQSIWQPRTQVPATAGHLLEFRATEAGMLVAGFVLLIPHYLAETDYPAATLSAIDRIASSTGRVFDLDGLRRENMEYLGKVDEQIVANDELARMVTGLEERYDAYIANLSGGAEASSTGLLHESDLPSADELAAELERYLATRPNGDEDKPN
ncbi:PAC2 family protein [Microbacterium oryzae]|uniref:proteasome assembly chaperone family protein n=1 Tax=Microbacterium oryzae TaxID=743009 RepID=UPI0025B12910|nr:PAC2 family protein [Microbacterium oryzae]MDN3309529.1 PAC2 family protein [Microbacterium oryzae]